MSQRPDSAPVRPSFEAAWQAHGTVWRALEPLLTSAQTAADMVAECLRSGNKVLACGNGGSAADAQHFACELVGRFLRDRDAAAAIALTTDPSVMTAVSNDFGFEHVFARQVAALGNQGDVLVAISTSGNSPNVVCAAKCARERGIAVFALTGADSGLLGDCADHCIAVPSSSTPRIQEMHLLLLHMVCESVEHAI